jgi:hypothetical protein
VAQPGLSGGGGARPRKMTKTVGHLGPAGQKDWWVTEARWAQEGGWRVGGFLRFTLLLIKSGNSWRAIGERGLQLSQRGCRDPAHVEENKWSGLGREKGFRAKINKRIGWLQKCFRNWFKNFISKSIDLNIFKPNLNRTQNRINSN